MFESVKKFQDLKHGDWFIFLDSSEKARIFSKIGARTGTSPWAQAVSGSRDGYTSYILEAIQVRPDQPVQQIAKFSDKDS